MLCVSSKDVSCWRILSSKVVSWILSWILSSKSWILSSSQIISNSLFRPTSHSVSGGLNKVEMRIYWAFFYLGVSRNGDSELSDGFDNLLLAIGFILFKSKYEASPIPTFSYKLDTSGAIKIGKNLITLFHRPVIVSLYDPISLTFSKIGGSQRQGKISCFIDFDQISKRDSPVILLSL